MTEDSLLELLCETAASFYARGLAFGSTGNVSVRVGDLVARFTAKPAAGKKPA